MQLQLHKGSTAMLNIKECSDICRPKLNLSLLWLLQKNVGSGAEMSGGDSLQASGTLQSRKGILRQRDPGPLLI